MKKAVSGSLDIPTTEMVDWFKARTTRHCKLVVKYIDIISTELYTIDNDILKLALDVLQTRKNAHDADKFREPLMTPYVWIAWRYKNQRESNKQISISDTMLRRMDEATKRHILANPHHPECSAGQVRIDPTDRDKSTSSIDASKMEFEDVIEMVADWSAMAEELGGTAREWYEKCSNVRWTFSNMQNMLIRRCIKIVEDYLEKEKTTESPFKTDTANEPSNLVEELTAKKKVFLGGTCNDSTWRQSLKELLTIHYFDPVVDDWTPECQVEERKQRELCDYCLYVITPKMAGVYSIAEVVDDSNKRPEKTVFCYLSTDDDDIFNAGQIKSLDQVGEMVARNGGKFVRSLKEVADILNKTGQENGKATVED